MKDLTIILLTYNEEKNLPACLESISAVDSHVFAVDSFSSDKTLKILTDHGVHYVQHPFENYSRQRNWAQQQNPFSTKWLFHLDAGERFTPELVEWINTEFDPEGEIDGYMFSRRTLIFGKWVRYGGHYPNYHLRLYRKDKGYCEQKLYDQHFLVNGKTRVVKNRVDIVDTVLDNWQDFSRSHAHWAYLEAIDQLADRENTEGVVPSLWGNPMQRRRWLKVRVFQNAPLFARSFLYFIYRYFFRFGFLDGRVGLAFHFLQGFWFRFLIDACILELTQRMQEQQISLKQLIEKEYPQYKSLFKLQKETADKL